VAGVDRAGQPAGTDRRLSFLSRRGQQVEQGEPDRPLGVRVAMDDNLGIGPPGRPGGAVLGQQPVEPDPVHLS
jgi:hypothetical protein